VRIDKIVFYRDCAGDWRWTYRHWNGNVLADSGQGYTRKRDAEKGVVRVTGVDLTDPEQIRVVVSR
jgi:uncharacterized protein YegP (UPF0339 family)